LRVNLADIRQEGLELNCGETPEELDLEYPDTGFGPIRTHVRLARMGDDVMVTGDVEAELALECARCVRPFNVPLHLDLNLLFRPKPGPHGGRAGTESEDPEEDTDYLYNGKTIDLGEAVREEILLSVPMVPVCKPDCRGLCGGCGKNLNLEKCVCHTEERNGSSQT
jgi:uncharacterized protein